MTGVQTCALPIFGSSPVDLLAIGPYAVRRGALFRTGDGGEEVAR